MENLVAQVEGIIFRNEDNGYTVAEVSADERFFTCVGMMPSLREGERVSLTGSWKQHISYGEQFSVESCRPLPPDSKEGLIRYLASGAVPGVGEATAQRIVDTLGLEALELIRRKPDCLRKVSGIGAVKAKAIQEALSTQLEMQEVMIFLQSLEIGQALAAKIYKLYGAQTPQIVSHDPYKLVEEVDGIGFLTADRIALKLDIQKDAPTRIRAGIKHALESAAGNIGHCCLPLDVLTEKAQELLHEDAEKIQQELSGLMLERAIIQRQMDGRIFCYATQYYYAENQIALLLNQLAAAEVEAPCKDVALAVEKAAVRLDKTLSQEQRSAVATAVSSGLTVITGGPGTGKTTVIRCLIDMLELSGMKVELAAPTGRAAKRMNEASGRDARTLHRLLEYAYDGDAGSFNRDQDHPLECSAVVVDEVSMVDVFLMQALVRAMQPGMRLILVGDSDQLPSVGPGMVLRDIMASGIAKVCHLTQIFRQDEASMIVTNAHRVNAGQMPQFSGGKDFFFERQPDTEAVFLSVKAMIASRIPGYLHCDPMNDIQVLAPMKKGDLGVIRLNERLQEAFNPPKPDKNEFKRGSTVFRLGDKVMQTRNNYQLKYTNVLTGEEGEGVFNGDMGRIVDITTSVHSFSVRFDDDRLVCYDFAQAEDLSLAYAISIHKSQGCEFPVVILPLFGGPPMLLSRNLLYTAITRAKSMVVLVGSDATIAAMVKNRREIQRYTGLQEAIRQQQTEET